MAHDLGRSEALSAELLRGVHKHVLANGSASFRSHPNHSNKFRPELTHSGIPRTKESRAKTGSFGALEPYTFTCKRISFYLAHVKLFGKECPHFV